MQRALIIFVRMPQLGLVKTRLAKSLGERHTLELYRCFVADTLALARRVSADIIIAFNGSRESDARSWLGQELHYIPQRGNDIGRRMSAGFHDTFSMSYSSALCIGSDIPDLPHGYLREAFDALERHSAVIGPTQDGGYCCIGFTKESFDEAFFEGIPWGREGVFQKTVQAFTAAGMPFFTLPVWQDIDSIDDLLDFLERAHRNQVTHLQSYQYARGTIGL